MGKPDASRWAPLGLALILLAGCSKGEQMRAGRAPLDVYDVAPAPVGSDAPAAAQAPQIAYTFAVTYGFDRDTVAVVQARQIAWCRGLGPNRCQLVKSSLSAGKPDDTTDSETALLLDARGAAGGLARLDAIATDGGAAVTHRETTAVDVTKQVIDTDARVRAKQALAARLLATIQSRDAKVGELVQAEQAYSGTQEALDAARGEQAALARRVRMSAVNITYSYTPAGENSPIRRSLSSIGETLASSVATLITAAVVAAPWVLILAALLWVRRRRGWRWPLRPRAGPPGPR